MTAERNPDRNRTIRQLVLVDGLSYGEAAKMLNGVNRCQVAGIIHRTTDAQRKALGL